MSYRTDEKMQMYYELEKKYEDITAHNTDTEIILNDIVGKQKAFTNELINLLSNYRGHLNDSIEKQKRSLFSSHSASVKEKELCETILNQCISEAESNLQLIYDRMSTYKRTVYPIPASDFLADYAGCDSTLYNHFVFEDSVYNIDHMHSVGYYHLSTILEENCDKKIMIYPPTVTWEPFQTPQQLVLSFAKKGWLCFWARPKGETHDNLLKLQDNIYQVTDTLLLSCLNHVELKNDPLVMVTWAGSIPFIKHLPKARIWYHVLDHLEIFSLYDNVTYEKAHKELVTNSDIVSYVAKPLLSIIDRADSIYLPNACNPQDISGDKPETPPEDMVEILSANKKIIGYFGWIAEWMNYQMVYDIAQARKSYEFVFIGPIDTQNSTSRNGVELLSSLDNVHFLGRKKYDELPSYACYFNVAIIPFQINEKMDCVSPIKFYEYCAYGIPTVCSYMPEMEQYVNEYIYNCRSDQEFLNAIDSTLNEQVQILAKKNARTISINNTWDSRTSLIEEKYNKTITI